MTLSDSGHMALVERAGSGSEIRETQTILEDFGSSGTCKYAVRTTLYS